MGQQSATKRLLLGLLLSAVRLLEDGEAVYGSECQYGRGEAVHEKKGRTVSREDVGRVSAGGLVLLVLNGEVGLDVDEGSAGLRVS